MFHQDIPTVTGLVPLQKPSNIEPSTVRHANISNKSSNNKGKSTTYFCNNNNDNINIKNLTVNINFLNYYFNNNG